MVDINLPNAITVGLIAVVAVLLVRFATKAAGINSPV